MNILCEFSFLITIKQLAAQSSGKWTARETHRRRGGADCQPLPPAIKKSPGLSSRGFSANNHGPHILNRDLRGQPALPNFPPLVLWIFHHILPVAGW
jgi:hypothetical protein